MSPSDSPEELGQCFSKCEPGDFPIRITWLAHLEGPIPGLSTTESESLGELASFFFSKLLRIIPMPRSVKNHMRSL